MSRDVDPARFAETERALRDWLATEARLEPPASLAEALPRAAARARPVPGPMLRVRRGGRMSAVRGLAAAAAVAAIVLGALAISSSSRHGASTGSASSGTGSPTHTTTPPPSTSLPAGPVALGTQQILDAGRDAYEIVGLVANGGRETLVTTYFGPNATKPDGTRTCGSSEISTWDAAGAMRRATYDSGRIVAVAGLADGTLAALADLGCDGARALLRSADAGLTWLAQTVSGTSWPRGSWLGGRPTDPKQLATWEPSGAGGILTWTTDAGETWKSHGEPRRPLAWDTAGLWFLRGEILELSSTPAGPTLEAGTAHGAVAGDGDAGVLFRGSLVYRDATGVSLLDLRTNSTRHVLNLDAVRFAATDGYVAAVGLDGHGGLVAAVSSDGIEWRTAALEKQQATSAAGVAVAATPDRLYVAATVTSAVAVVPAASIAPSPSETPVPTPRSTPGGAPLDWTRVPYPTTSGGTTADLVAPVVAARHDGGFLSAQWTRNGIVVRSSPDGRTWSDAGTLHGSDMAIDGLIWTAGEYVLLETAAQPSWPATSPPGADTRPYVFTSPDVSHWTRHPATVADTPSYTTGLAASGRRLVLVGWSRSETTLWTSPDGLTWTTPKGPWRAAAAATGPAGFVAAGSQTVGSPATAADARSVASVWTSPDGTNWSRAVVGQPVDGRSASIQTIVRGPSGFLALGTRFMGQVGPGSEVTWGGVWRSADGSSWAFHDAPALDGLSFHGLVWANGEYVTLAADSDGNQFLLTSADGSAWSVAAVPEVNGRTGPAGSGPGLVTDGSHVLLDAGDAYFVR